MICRAGKAFAMSVRILPSFFAFIVAGRVNVLLPQKLLTKWIGAESGIRGILGWKFVLIRVVSTFLLPPIAGLIAQIVFAGAN